VKFPFSLLLPQGQPKSREDPPNGLETLVNVVKEGKERTMSSQSPASPAAAAAAAPKKKSKTVPFYFGGVASCMAAVCTHPLDTVKVWE